MLLPLLANSILAVVSAQTTTGKSTPGPSTRPFIFPSSSSTNPPPTTEEFQEECVDLIDFCEQLKPICIGTIIVDQLNQLTAVVDAIDQSKALPALQSAFSPEETEGDGTTRGPVAIDTKTIENNLPLIKESLPLIRESLPLIRESLPLIRQFMDPLYYSGDSSTCQKKITCKSCRECPKLRDAVTAMVESLCPATCRICGQAPDGEEAAANLVNFYV